MVYRRPYLNQWNYLGDEFIFYGDFDVIINLPPIPFSGEWQIRLGYCALPTRGMAQIYFDDIPQRDPLDMRIFLDDESIIGSDFSKISYFSMTDEQKTEDQKALKNKGFYRGPVAGYHTDGHVMNEFVTNARTFRRVLCQSYIDHTQKHYLRIKQIGERIGNNNEFSIDYLELVPKSIYSQDFESDL